MLVSTSERPRELRWYHAGPMLYGDWGTSRFYVLGLAFYYALHASFYYVLGVCSLVAAVGWAYTIVCRCYPDGGGVYSAAKHTSRTLAVIGALLLFADYIITASLSALDAMHYLAIPDFWVPICAIGAIGLIGIINYIGPRKAGTFALVVALGTLLLTLVLLAFSIPHLAEGWRAIHRPTEPYSHQWLMLVNVVLALSGVEAIANMTGIMVHPVEKTSKKAIWPVLIEVVVFNLIFAVAMNGLPALTNVHLSPAPAYQKDEQIREVTKQITEAQNQPVPDQGQISALKTELEKLPQITQDDTDAKNAILRFMGKHYVGNWFASLAGVVFGLLLLSAVNTAVADMISIQYVMSRDTELPHSLTKLNMFGVPWLALLPAIILPIVVLCFVTDLEKLADLYAIGVVGAISINLGSCTYNKTLPLKLFERCGMGILTVILVAIELTLAYQKPHALMFAGGVLVLGLLMRFSTKTYPKMAAPARGGVLTAAAFLLLLATVLIGLNLSTLAGIMAHSLPVIHTVPQAMVMLLILAGLLLIFSGSSASSALNYFRNHRLLTPALSSPPGTGLLESPSGKWDSTGPGELDFSKSKVLVATRGAPRLLEFAANYCHKTHGLLFVLFVRQVNVNVTGTISTPPVSDDPEALNAFKIASEICAAHGVQMLPIYAVSSDVSYTILDFAATYSVESVLMGVSRQGTLIRALRGDVISAVADNLPDDISLLIHA